MYPLIRRASGPGTVVIPILNIYGTGERMAEDLPGIEVLNGCIYISAASQRPGVIRMSGKIFRIVYGRVDGRKDNPMLFQLEEDLRKRGLRRCIRIRSGGIPCRNLPWFLPWRLWGHFTMCLR